MIVVALLAAFCGVRIHRTTPTRLVDRPLLWVLAAIAFQLIPLPPAIMAWLSPHLDDYFATVTLLPPDQMPGLTTAHPLSIDPRWTAYSLGLVAMFVLFFWTLRRLLDQGGTRGLVRGIVWIGLALALTGVVFRAVSPHLLYGFWPVQGTSEPMGPFANRNHFATWLLMAVPLAMSYLLMRLESRETLRDKRPPLTQLAGTLQARNLWLIAAATAMSLGIFASASRSGIVGLVAGGVFGGLLSRPFMKRHSRTWVIASGVLIVLVLASYADIGHVLQRVEMTFAVQASPGRLVIWRDTWPAVRDFWLTGTGAGTYQAAMVVYQVALRGVTYFNQAHNHYLHVAEEGGLLLTIPALATLIAVGLGIRRRLLEDETATHWLRAGAATGLFAVAVQSIWETGLRMPANALLCAALMAIALHEPPAMYIPGPRDSHGRR